MKFTDGYWQIKKQISPLFAVEYASNRVDGKELTVYAPVKHVENRGDCPGQGLLTVRLSSPAENVIKVSMSHFEGSVEKGPFIEIQDTDAEVNICEDKDTVTYESGSLKAVVDKRPFSWGIAFYDSKTGCRLTDTGYHNMAYMVNRDTGKSYMVEQLALDVDEYIYGLGERFTPFIKNGQVVEMWNEDGGTASEIAYKNIPFYLSNKGYGVFVGDERDVSFEIASEKVERIQFSVIGERLEYYIIGGGSPKAAVSAYTKLTGRPALPPAWSFGLWLTTSFLTDYDEETCMGFIEGMRERDIPLRVFHFDCYWMEAFEWCNFTWDPKTFPNPVEMLKRYHERGLQICVWINPYIGQKSPLFRECKENGYFVKKTDGSVWQTDKWQAGMGIIDFTNPAAAKWYVEKLKALLDMGVDCFKTDFGERIPVKDIVYYDGSDPLKMHNYYTYLYNQTVFHLLEKEKGVGKAVLFARSATVGGQKFPVHWGGDSEASYPSMAETLRGGLSLACSGFGYWSHDIGGFEKTAEADVYKRWCQFGLLSSHSRLHGSKSYRVPWLYDEEACDVLRRFTKLKCLLMPYLYHQAVYTHNYGIPMLRPMFMEFPGDRVCETLDKQFMMGDSLLAAPIFKASGMVEYYLPDGKWFHLFTKETVTGGSFRKEHYDFMSMPLFIKAGSIIVMGSCDAKPDYDYCDGARLLIFLPENGMSASTEVVDLDGQVVLSISAVREDGRIKVITGGKDENLSCHVLGQEECEVLLERKGSV